jgi:ribosomal protein L11 methyltransferase
MSATWLRVTVRSPSDELHVLLLEGLVASGASAVEERGHDLVTYLPLNADVSAVLDRLRGTLRELLGAEPPEFEVEDVADQDWLALWREGLGPRRVGDRIIVAPNWSAVEAAPRELVVRIDPQMAFGTGEHATTRGVLRLMQGVLHPGDRVLDVGAGSAILAIAAALLGAESVVAAEYDGDAVPNAAENIARNGVADRVTLLQTMVDHAFLEARGPGAFDGIVANVLRSVLQPLLPGFRDVLVPHGWTILSGILAEEAAGMRSAAAAAGFVVAAEDEEEQWWSVLLRRSR